MASPIPSSLRVLVPALAARLSEVTGVTPNRVLVAQRQDVPRFQGDSDVLIRVSRPAPIEGYSKGAGRVATMVRRLVQVTPRVRLAVDQSDRDDLALLTLGDLEEACVDALHIWVPQDGDNWLLQEPIHWDPSAEPVHDTPVSQSWLHSDLIFDLFYQLASTDNSF